MGNIKRAVAASAFGSPRVPKARPSLFTPKIIVPKSRNTRDKK